MVADETIEPVPVKEETLVDQAHKAAASLKEEREKMEKTMNDLREDEAKRILSGRSSAGTPPVKEEISDVEYAKRALRGQI